MVSFKIEFKQNYITHHNLKYVLNHHLRIFNNKKNIRKTFFQKKSTCKSKIRDFINTTI